MRNDMKKKNIRVKPKNPPKPINTHFISYDDGKTWIEEPGTLAAKVVTCDEEDVDDDISKIFGDFLEKLSEPVNSPLSIKILNCRHKMYAVRFHKIEIEKEIEKQAKYFDESFTPGAGVQFERENLKLIYNTEAFLFQVKSNLDILIQALGLVVPPIKNFRTFKHSGQGVNYISGGKVIKELEKSGEYPEILNLLENNRKEWIQELVKMRDVITHYSNLKGFNCFVEEPYRGDKEVEIEYPKMPNGVRLDEYCEIEYNKLLNLYKNILILILDIINSKK